MIEEKFYDLIEKGKKKIDSLNIPHKERYALHKLVCEIIQIYEESKINLFGKKEKFFDPKQNLLFKINSKS